MDKDFQSPLVVPIHSKNDNIIMAILVALIIVLVFCACNGHKKVGYKLYEYFGSGRVPMDRRQNGIMSLPSHPNTNYDFVFTPFGTDKQNVIGPVNSEFMKNSKPSTVDYTSEIMDSGFMKQMNREKMLTTNSHTPKSSMEFFKDFESVDAIGDINIVGGAHRPQMSEEQLSALL